MARGKKQKKGSSGFNLKNSKEFLERNAQKPEIQVMNSGLQVQVVEDVEGGASPGAEDEVRVHQRITLVDGSIVDDSYSRSQPETFLMSEAIPGYREGLLEMTVGSRWKLFIPPDLAWGKRGAGKKIGPDQVLIIDVRLLEINSA